MWTYLLALALLVAACGVGSESTDATAAPAAEPEADVEEESKVVVDQAGDVADDRSESDGEEEDEATSAELVEDSAEPAEPEAEPEVPVSLSADEAIDAWDDYIGQFEEYLNGIFVDGDATFDDAVEIVSALDPALVDGEAEAVALEFHDCQAEAGVSSAFFEFTGIEIEIEHLSQTPIDENTWALEYRAFNRIEGFPEQVVMSTSLVTADGIGPTLEMPEDGDCVLPRSEAGEALAASAADDLGLDLSAPPETVSPELAAGEAFGVPTCEEVLAAAPGTFTDGCSYEGTPNTLTLFGVEDCGTGSAWRFDLEVELGTWWGVEGADWIELSGDEFTADFITSQCG